MLIVSRNYPTQSWDCRWLVCFSASRNRRYWTFSGTTCDVPGSGLALLEMTNYFICLTIHTCIKTMTLYYPQVKSVCKQSPLLVLVGLHMRKHAVFNCENRSVLNPRELTRLWYLSHPANPDSPDRESNPYDKSQRLYTCNLPVAILYICFVAHSCAALVRCTAFRTSSRTYNLRANN